MALRRNGKDDRQLNRKNYRRPSGRTAEFFDLRETDQDSYSDSNSGSYYSGSYSGRSSGRPGDSDSARPYRERHRVEVNTQDYYYGSGENRAGGYSGRTEDMYGGQQSSGRIVHGNAPGNRSSRTQTSDRRDIAPDLLYGSSTGSNAAGNGRSGANSRTGSRNAGTAGRGDSPGMTGRSSYSAYGTDYNYGRSGSTYSSYGRSDRTYSTAGGNRQNTAGSGSYSSYSRNDYTETTTTETITVEEITMAVITAVRAHIQTAGTRMKRMPVKNIRRKSTETASRRMGRNTMTSMVKEIIPAKRH